MDGMYAHIRPGRFLGIIGQDPSASKFNQLHAGILKFSSMSLEFNPHIPEKGLVTLRKS